MKAVIQTKPGNITSLKINEARIPTPENREVLIKIHAATVTRGDVIMAKLNPLLFIPMRLLGFRRKTIPGHEFAGEIEAVGSEVTSFRIGEKVYGTTTGLSVGANAEYVCVPEKWKTGVISKMPENLSYEEAAALPVGGMTALQILSIGNIRDGQKVLVYGASGSVGTYAVQLTSRFFKADVTGVCGPSNIDLVKSLGAAHVIDYKKENPYQNGQVYDVIFDAVGKTKATDWKDVLKPNGSFLTVKTITSEKETNLQILTELAERGKLVPVIDRQFPLSEVTDAYKYVEIGHKRGNVVIIIGNK